MIQKICELPKGEVLFTEPNVVVEYIFDPNVGAVLSMFSSNSSSIDECYYDGRIVRETDILFTLQSCLSTIEPYNRINPAQYIGFSFQDLKNIKVSSGMVLINVGNTMNGYSFIHRESDWCSGFIITGQKDELVSDLRKILARSLRTVGLQSEDNVNIVLTNALKYHEPIIG